MYTYMYIHTWNKASSPSNSSRDGRLLMSSSGPGSIPGGHRKSQSDTPMTPCMLVVSGATCCRLCWLPETWELGRGDGVGGEASKKRRGSKKRRRGLVI